MNTPKIKMTQQVVEALGDQETIDAVAEAIAAFESGGPMPEGVEITRTEGISDEDKVLMLAEYEGKLPEDTLNSMAKALAEDDMETFFTLSQTGDSSVQ